MRVAAVISDLMLFSRIDHAAAEAGASLTRLDSPADLPDGDLDLVLVDWSARDQDWTRQLVAWCARAPEARMILFGRHTELDAHADARSAGLGPMWARSRLIGELPSILGVPAKSNGSAGVRRSGSP